LPLVFQSVDRDESHVGPTAEIVVCAESKSKANVARSNDVWFLEKLKLVCIS